MAGKEGIRKPQGYFYRYLVDARDPLENEYAVFYNEKSDAVHVQAFTSDAGALKLKANEVVYAFDDEPEREKGVLKVKAYEIRADEQGQPKLVFESGVQYAVSYSLPDPETADDGMRITYTLTDESRKALHVEGFSADFPSSFSARVSGAPEDAAEAPDRNLHFPPHHPYDRAVAARSAIDEDMVPAGFKPPLRLVAEPEKPAAPAGMTPPPPPKRPSVSDAQLRKALEKYCRNLTELAKEGRLDPVTGRDDVIREVLKTLSNRRKSNPCLVGEAGVGKTAIAEGTAQWCARGEDVPKNLRNTQFLELDMEKMQAIPNAGLRGAVEAELKPIIDGLAERGGWFTLPGQAEPSKIVLFIDELHAQLTTGSASNTPDAAERMKKFFNTPGVCTLSATTRDEYDKHIAKDKALARRFKPINVPAAGDDLSVKVMMTAWPAIRDHQGIERDITETDARYVVRMGNRYVHDIAQPDKSITILEGAAANAVMRGSAAIEKIDIDDAVAVMGNVPKAHLNKSNADVFRDLEKNLSERVIGQPSVLKIARRLKAARAGTARDPRKPLAVFILPGPSHTGKTLTAEEINRCLNGTDDSLVRLNMAEYGSTGTASRLIGAAPGYVGYDTEGTLTGPVRKNPFRVVLMDECEKAHPDAFNILLNAWEAKGTDNKGRTVDYSNTVFVLTANLGSRRAMEKLREKRLGFNASSGAGGAITEADVRKRQKEIDLDQMQAVLDFFPPELVNRAKVLGGVYIFQPLGVEDLKVIVDNEIGALNARFADPGNVNMPGVRIEITEALRDQLAEKSFDPVYNAGKVKEVINEGINIPLADWVLDGDKRAEIDAYVLRHGGARLVIDGVEDGLKLKIEPPFVPEISRPFATASSTRPSAPPPANNDDPSPSSDRRPSTRPRSGMG